MLGRFLEYSVGTTDIRESLEFYARLGFSQAEVGEAWAHPYAVLTDGRLCIGLHQLADFTPSMTFVRPQLLRHADRLEEYGVELEIRRLGGDVFNELGWREPGGHLIRLLEARTFSPSKRSAAQLSLCGYFLEIALPCVRPADAKHHWERIGFVAMDEPGGAATHVSCTSDTVNVGLYDPAQLPEPALRFESADPREARAALERAKITPLRRRPVLPDDGESIVVAAPEGTLLLLGAGDDG